MNKGLLVISIYLREYIIKKQNLINYKKLHMDLNCGAILLCMLRTKAYNKNIITYDYSLYNVVIILMRTYTPMCHISEYIVKN